MHDGAHCQTTSLSLFMGKRLATTMHASTSTHACRHHYMNLNDMCKTCTVHKITNYLPLRS